MVGTISPAGLIGKASRTFRLGRALRFAWAASPVLVLVQAGLLFLQGSLPLAALLGAKGVVDAVARAATATNRAGALHEAILWLGLTTLVVVASAVVSGVSSIVAEDQAQRIADYMADLIHDRSAALDLAFYENPAFHDTLHRAQQEGLTRPSRIAAGLGQILSHCISLAAMVGLLASLRWWMAAALLVAALPGVAVRIRFSNKLFGWQKAASGAERRVWYFHWLLTAPSQAAEVRLFGIASLLRQRFCAVRSTLRRERLDLGKRRSRADALAQTVAAGIAFCALWILVRDAATGLMTLGAFVMYVAAFQRGLSSLQGLLGSLANLYEDNLFLTHLDDFLALRSSVTGPAEPRPFPSRIERGIRVDDVSFRYGSSSAPVLDGVTFSIAPGQVVALVGANGSGKTTLVKLLARLHDPDRGRISVDDVDLKEMEPGDVRRNLAVLLQDFGRYALPARENVWLGDVDRPLDDPRIDEAALRSGAAEMVASLPRGWETVLGSWFEDGRELSTGQWQKIALARTLFRDAQLVVLDEPSASMDPLAERRLFEGFRQLVAGRSAIFISHRFSTVRMADRIVVLDKGRVAEEGSHEELLLRGGIYARMFAAQADPYR